MRATYVAAALAILNELIFQHAGRSGATQHMFPPTTLDIAVDEVFNIGCAADLLTSFEPPDRTIVIEHGTNVTVIEEPSSRR